VGDEGTQTLVSELLLAYNLARCGMYEEALPLAIHVRDTRLRQEESDRDFYDKAESYVDWISLDGNFGTA
jgi:hypothetical protein